MPMPGGPAAQVCLIVYVTDIAVVQEDVSKSLVGI